MLMPDDLGLNLEDQLITSEGTTPADAGAEQTTSQQPAQPAGTPEATGLQQGSGPSTTPPATLPASLLARAQQAGLPLEGIDTPERFQEFLLDQLIQSRPYADYGRSALTQTSHGQPQQQQSDGQQLSAEDEFDEDKYFSEAWSVPQLSPGAQFALDHGAFDTDERGFIIPKAGLEQIALPHIKEINDFQQAKLSQNETFAANPVKFIYEKLLPALEHRFDGRYRDQVQERFQEYEHQNFEEKFKEENKAWLYTPDGKAFSPEGLRFRDAIQNMRAKGITDPQTLAEWGLKLAGVDPNSHAGKAAQEAVQDANQATDGQPAPHKNAPPKDPVTGKFVKAEEPPTKQESFIDKARRQAAAASSSGSFVSDGGNVVASEGDLDNMFPNAWREYAGSK
jgi:hypothetical protein